MPIVHRLQRTAKFAPIQHQSKPLPKPLQGRVDRLARKASAAYATQIQTHLEGRVRGMMTSNNPFQVDMLLSRLEAAPLPKFGGWIAGQGQQLSSISLSRMPKARPTNTTTLSHYVDGVLVAHSKAIDDEWASAGAVQAMSTTSAEPMPEHELVALAVAAAKDHNSARPQRMHKPTAYEQLDSYLRTDSADYWDVDKDAG